MNSNFRRFAPKEPSFTLLRHSLRSRRLTTVAVPVCQPPNPNSLEPQLQPLVLPQPSQT